MSKAYDLCQEIVDAFSKRKETLACAESCTGGLVCEMITEIPGSSAMLSGGFVVYSNFAKSEVLDVKRDLIATHGAVSEECARALCENARRILKTNWAISITGIAGPTGGSVEKPIGMVCFGLCNAKETWTQTQYFSDLGRKEIREESAVFSLNWLLHQLKV